MPMLSLFYSQYIVQLKFSLRVYCQFKYYIIIYNIIALHTLPIKTQKQIKLKLLKHRIH